MKIILELKYGLYSDTARFIYANDNIFNVLNDIKRSNFGRTFKDMVGLVCLMRRVGADQFDEIPTCDDCIVSVESDGDGSSLVQVDYRGRAFTGCGGGYDKFLERVKSIL